MKTKIQITIELVFNKEMVLGYVSEIYSSFGFPKQFRKSKQKPKQKKQFDSSQVSRGTLIVHLWMKLNHK